MITSLKKNKDIWYGKDVKGGCLGEGIPELRYLVWYKCKFILCEKWFLAPAAKYWLKTLDNIHNHILTIDSIPIDKNWKCDVNTEKCAKKIESKNQGKI